MTSIALAALMITLALSPRTAQGEPTEPGRVALGPWGGRHIALEVGDDGAEVEFDCALGTIGEPLALDDAGTFDAQGTFSPQRGGPEREGEVLPRHAARYRGSVEGDVMRLEVSPEESGESSAASSWPTAWSRPAGSPRRPERELAHFPWRTSESVEPGPILLHGRDSRRLRAPADRPDPESGS